MRSGTRPEFPGEKVTGHELPSGDGPRQVYADTGMAGGLMGECHSGEAFLRENPSNLTSQPLTPAQKVVTASSHADSAIFFFPIIPQVHLPHAIAVDFAAVKPNPVQAALPSSVANPPRRTAYHARHCLEATSIPPRFPHRTSSHMCIAL